MDKRRLHHLWTRLRPVKPWYFLALFLILVTVSAFALRNNNLHMASLRQAVYVADENNGDVEAALQNLRSYVAGHMNTSLSAGNDSVYPPIQLKYTYQRLVQAAGSQTSQANAELYTAAQKYCEQQVPTGFSGRYRLDCIESYIGAHGTGEVTNIPDSLYKFDFVSPRWSPDLAGWSMAAAIVCLLVGIAFAIIRRRVQWLAK